MQFSYRDTYRSFWQSRVETGRSTSQLYESPADTWLQIVLLHESKKNVKFHDREKIRGAPVSTQAVRARLRLCWFCMAICCCCSVTRILVLSSVISVSAAAAAAAAGDAVL